MYIIIILLFIFILLYNYNNNIKLYGGKRYDYLRIQYDVVKDKNFIKNKFNSKNVIILDVRTKYEINQGHICNALLLYSFIDNYKIIIKNIFMKHIKNNKQFELIIYCNSGKRALKAAKILHKNKFNNKIYIITQGGYNELVDLMPQKNICKCKCKNIN